MGVGKQVGRRAETVIRSLLCVDLRLCLCRPAAAMAAAAVGLEVFMASLVTPMRLQPTSR